ncbi:MAG: LytTR family DNA-binding domain-containing protein [Candidatus Kapaibacteriota bacterium]
MKKTYNPAGFVSDPDIFYSSLAVLKAHSDFDFHYLSQTDDVVHSLRHVLATQHLRVVFVQASTEREVFDIAEVLRDCATPATPPVAVLALPEIVQPHTAFLQAQTAFAGLLPLPFDTDLMTAQLEMLRQTLTKQFFDIWLYQLAKENKKAAQTDLAPDHNQESDSLVLTSPHGDITIRKTDILCCLAQNTYTEVLYQSSPPTTTQNSKQAHRTIHAILDIENLKAWEDKLPKSAFMRVHRSALVNIKNIDHIERHYNRKGLVLTLRDGREIKVARDKTQLFLQRHSEQVVVTKEGTVARIEIIPPPSEAGERTDRAENTPPFQRKNFRLPKQQQKTAKKAENKRP